MTNPENESRMLSLLGKLNHLYECNSSDQLPHAVEQVLLNMVPCDFVGWYDVGEDMKIRSHDHLFDGLKDEFPDYLDDLQQLFDNCPLTKYFTTGGEKTVLRRSDFPPIAFPDKALFQHIGRMFPLSFHALGARLVRPQDGFIALPIKRNTEDFSDAEILLVEEVLEHIKRHATALGLMRPKDAPQKEPCPRAHQDLLSETFTLTAREAEVAYWTAQGKCNYTIAKILGISHHTVRTHLQRVFQKMGLENRATLAHTVWNL